MQKETICPVCGKQFNIPQTRPNQKYCSRDCSVIGRRSTKEDAAKKRIDSFIESLPDLHILDVLDGKLELSTNNRMTVTGARMWEGKRFLVLVVD